MTATTRRATAVVVLVLAPIALLATWLVVRAGLGPRLATHFRLGGRADGFSPTTPFAVGMIVACAVAAALAVAVLYTARGHNARPYAAVFGFVAWILAASAIASLVAGHGVAPHEARSGRVASLVSILAALAAAALVHALVHAPGPLVSGRAEAGDAAPAYRLGAQERAAWVGAASSRRLLGVAVVVAIAGAVLLWTWPGVGAICLVVAVLIAWLHSLTARVDGSGLTVRVGPLPWPRVHVALDDVTAVRTETIEPLRWGGWGYRITPRGTAIVVRRGDGLVVSRRDRSDLAVTVDDAAGAVALLEALRARATS